MSSDQQHLIHNTPKPSKSNQETPTTSNSDSTTANTISITAATTATTTTTTTTGSNPPITQQHTKIITNNGNKLIKPQLNFDNTNPANTPAPTNTTSTTNTIPKQEEVIAKSGPFKLPKEVLMSSTDVAKDSKNSNIITHAASHTNINSVSISGPNTTPNIIDPSTTIHTSSSSNVVTPTALTNPPPMIQTPSNASTVTSPLPPPTTTTTPTQSPAVINKNTISNINKTLKAKQKVVHSPHSKNPTLISNIINSKPQTPVFANMPSTSNLNTVELEPPQSTITKSTSTHSIVSVGTITSTPSTIVQNTTPNGNNENAAETTMSIIQSTTQAQPTLSNSTSTYFTLHPNNSATNQTTTANIPTIPSTSNLVLPQQPPPPPPPVTPSIEPESTTKKGKHKKISKQSSARTDFFAAKLASAVDDIESSDSDETFVYENNNNDFDTISNAANIENISVAGNHTPSILEGHGPMDHQHSLEFPLNKPFKNAIGIGTPTGSQKQASLANSLGSAHDLDLSMKEKRPSQSRTYSIDETGGGLSGVAGTSTPAPGRNIASDRSLNQSPMSPFGDVVDNRSGLGIIDAPRNFSVSNSINQVYNDDTYSYNEIEDDDNMMDDEMSNDGDFYKGNTTIVAPQNSRQSLNVQQSQQLQNQQLQAVVNTGVANSISSKNTSKKNYKSSNSSSKLRSTTSKLFDKKGSQPRRYSTIPDDFDIEDFDDELIYYDNNIGFPYNNNNNNNVNETTALLNGGHHKIPHYRSLNLNFPNAKRQNNPLKGKRYLSSGQPLVSENHSEASIHNARTGNNDETIPNRFPFPYSQQQQQQQQQSYYYDYDEFDQESHGYDPAFDLPDLSMNRKISRNFGKPRFSNGQFIMPKKQPVNDIYHRVNCIKSFLYTMICIFIILTIGFVLGFVLATTKDLTDVAISSIENPIVSQDELVFNIVVDAFNPGWFSVDIEDVELDIFARSGYLPEDEGSKDLFHIGNYSLYIEDSSGKVETVKLGTITKLESIMNFKGGFFSREPSSQKGEIKLLNPGKNLTSSIQDNKGNNTEPDNSKKWEIICQNPFDLIISGVLKYDLPMARNTKSVVVRKIGYIDPTLFVIP